MTQCVQGSILICSDLVEIKTAEIHILEGERSGYTRILISHNFIISPDLQQSGVAGVPQNSSSADLSEYLASLGTRLHTGFQDQLQRIGNVAKVNLFS